MAYISALQEQLTAAQGGLQEQEQSLAAARRELQQQGQDLTQVKEELRQKAEQLAQAQAIIAELERELFGAKERRRRHLPPVELEKQPVILEPADQLCPKSGEPRTRIGQEVTTEYDYLPAKLIIRQIVRPKYGRCGKPCCQGVSMAPLPPRLGP